MRSEPTLGQHTDFPPLGQRLFRAQQQLVRGVSALNYFHPFWNTKCGGNYMPSLVCALTVYILQTLQNKNIINQSWLLNYKITLGKAVKLSQGEHGRISRPIRDGLSTQPTSPPATKPPDCTDITLHNSKSCATSSKVTRVNLGFLLIVHQSIVPLVANLMEQNGNL